MPPHKAKKRSMSDRVLEELSPHFNSRLDGGLDDDLDRVPIADIEEPPTTTTQSGTQKTRVGRLRARAPLDESFATGRYSAVVAGGTDDNVESDNNKKDSMDDDDGDVEGRLDDIFGLLDEGNEDSGARTAKSEGDLEQWWNKRQAAKKTSRQRVARVSRDDKGDSEGVVVADRDASAALDRLTAGDATRLTNDDDVNVLKQISDLRKRQLDVTVGNAAASNATTGANGERLRADETKTRDQARRSVAAIGELIALRMKMQPAVARALSFPQYYAWPSYHAALSAAVEDNSSVDVESLPSITEAASHLRRIVADLIDATPEESRQTHRMWNALVRFQQRVQTDTDRYVNDAASQLTGTSSLLAGGLALKALNQPLLSQIRGVIAGKVRLLNRAQRNRAHVRILGHPSSAPPSASHSSDYLRRVAEGDVDEEIFDDGDFVRELAQKYGHAELLRSASGRRGDAASVRRASSETPSSLFDCAVVSSRVGFHRKTKGRTIVTDPRPKLVGFMLPVPYVFLEAQDALLRSVLQ